MSTFYLGRKVVWFAICYLYGIRKKLMYSSNLLKPAMCEIIWRGVICPPPPEAT